MTTGLRGPNRHYTEGIKRTVIEEYLRGNHTQNYLEDKHGIRKRGAIRKWMRELGYEDIVQKASYLGTPIVPAVVAKKKTQAEESVQALEKRIKDLERKLEDEQLRSEAYSRIIDIAEKEFNLPIRKKPSTK